MVVAVWSPKGGSGVSVVAAGLAVVLSQSRGVRRARLVDMHGDQPNMFSLGTDPDRGVADWLAAGGTASSDALDRLAVPARSNLTVIGRGKQSTSLPGDTATGVALARALDGLPTVVDAGRPVDDAVRGVIEAATLSIVVVRPCYLALRRATQEPLIASAAGVVIVGEDHRAISGRDVAAVLGVPQLGRVRVRPSIARCVDAGLFASRLPADLTAPLRRVLQRVGMTSSLDEGAAA